MLVYLDDLALFCGNFAGVRWSEVDALQRLRQSDIDHILELQLNGQNARSNLKALHSRTNQLLGSQISQQLPVGQPIPIIEVRVIE